MTGYRCPICDGRWTPWPCPFEREFEREREQKANDQNEQSR